MNIENYFRKKKVFLKENVRLDKLYQNNIPRRQNLDLFSHSAKMERILSRSFSLFQFKMRSRHGHEHPPTDLSVLFFAWPFGSNISFCSCRSSAIWTANITRVSSRRWHRTSVTITSIDPSAHHRTRPTGASRTRPVRRCRFSLSHWSAAPPAARRQRRCSAIAIIPSGCWWWSPSSAAWPPYWPSWGIFLWC